MVPRTTPNALQSAQTREIIDLTHSEDSSPVRDLTHPTGNHHNRVISKEDNDDICLKKILDILPDVSVAHVLDLISGTSRTPSDCDRIISRLLDEGSYPREQDDAARRKRKRESDDTGATQGPASTASIDTVYLQRAKKRGELIECCCCYEEFLINRMTYCNGNRVHFFCLACAKTYVEGELGLGRCKPLCFADPDCRGTFSRGQLLEFLGQKSFDRLGHLQQQQEVAAAGLDFLTECPFCDFKAECPPVSVDREFRCENPKCTKISCRLCERETHVPLTCEEFKQDSTLAVRHQVEEAMSAALIRHCNKCKQPFVKEYGCNKMTCTHCRNVQCYVCSKNVVDYRHFYHGQDGTEATAACPLHDNMEARHEQEVKKAADKAVAILQAQNPEISKQDLAIKVSDRVSQTERTMAAATGPNRPPPRPRPPFPPFPPQMDLQNPYFYPFR
ncbi:unnamed protein product [Periconia digitata]|uniref:RING-type domain-containing protein n=1 Tax=Periconia digitata TaxID=1303443 RepID=A0A9W4U2R8_9PLEO|nr:unnamed protein product [Periconia digitata]